MINKRGEAQSIKEKTIFNISFSVILFVTILEISWHNKTKI